MDTTNSTVFIPGATSGIGLTLALRLQAAGSTVVIGGRRQALLDSLAEEHGLGTVQIDVADADSIRAAADQVLAAHPGLDTLVTMSGIMRNEDLRDPGHIEDALETIQTNLVGTIRLIDAFLPHLLTRPAATVMTVSSGLAFVPLTATPTYSATKAGVHSYTQALRQQLVGTAVEVLELAPPAVQTDLMGGADFGGMPLDAFVDEVMTIIETGGTSEVLVQNVQPLRWAERDGTHQQILEMMAGREH
ncbi:oxidoreductase [Curtobacterium sp. MCJR17_055]|uniref:SDR family oxidoreductase n=1 Tax=unclassified Curtobacterium TaxID=257496 RepID=UPI000D9A9C6F|nr:MULTISPECIES: SDR family NAD(P)-dependent oxidoreductase [unclassified Curtobacterium]PYY33570.1 oxidoreductase [Curtobacterium sp. MCBD17_029]PYY53419.1 oxidoreductase [Curtobacterium sp. MCJR17_055]PYY57333.1 oxidoreductase [Curtobacterium sp. MCPF17_015]WIB35581.1 SDR family NAD(P)-dependent oxidoreductase [Curtobacterium sp. MCJR17_043]